MVNFALDSGKILNTLCIDSFESSVKIPDNFLIFLSDSTVNLTLE